MVCPLLRTLLGEEVEVYVKKKKQKTNNFFLKVRENVFETY